MCSDHMKGKQKGYGKGGELARTCIACFQYTPDRSCHLTYFLISIDKYKK